ncbi:energy transducer TonB [Deltaproteobacteria bacterium]|nr:energy transducer TonB [Deltaproteobacteria bacterium]
MKRFLPAAALAVLFHTALFGMDVDLFFDKKDILNESGVVTVTMSYRKAEVVPQVERAPVKEQLIPKKKIVMEDKTFISSPVEDAVKMAEIFELSQPKLTDTITDNVDPTEESVDEKTVEKIVEKEGPQDNNISDIGVVLEAVPLYKRNPLPNYPRTARKRGYQGTVVLSVLVDERGLVKNLWVFESSGYRLLDNAAIKTVSEWLFEPGMKGNQKVEMWVQVPVQFELE